MGRRSLAKFKQQRRKQKSPPKRKPPKPGRWELPQCSAPKCERLSHFLIRPKNDKRYDGTFWAACTDCVDAIAAGVKHNGIDADVISYRAIHQLAGKAKSEVEEAQAQAPHCGGTGHIGIVASDPIPGVAVGGAVPCPGCEDCAEEG